MSTILSQQLNALSVFLISELRSLIGLIHKYKFLFNLELLAFSNELKSKSNLNNKMSHNNLMNNYTPPIGGNSIKYIRGKKNIS